MADQEALVQQLVGITAAPEDFARDLLRATNFNLEAAITLFYDESGGASTVVAPGPVPRATQQRAGAGVADDFLMPDLLGEMASAGVGGSNREGFDGDGVRAPLPVTRERLYTEQMLMQRHARPQTVQPERMDAFRDFSTEGGKGESSKGLASLFEPPTDLIFKGSLSAIKEKANEAKRWVLLNILDNNEFASHQLNRDTWADPALREIVGGSFIFSQSECTATVGKEIAQTYRLQDFPAILIVDPTTGAIMRQWVGFVDPARLAEELVPFMDTAIDSEHVGRLVMAHKRKQVGLAGAGTSTPKKNLTEEEQLQLALAESIQYSRPAERGRPEVISSSDDDDVSEDEQSVSDDDDQVESGEAAPVVEPAAARKDPEEVAAEAKARLPPEPAANDSAATRLAIRLPDGQRLVRRFLRSEPFETLHAWCISQCPEAAAGRKFSLVPGGAGGPAVPNTLDLSMSLEEAGVINAMLLLNWIS